MPHSVSCPKPPLPPLRCHRPPRGLATAGRRRQVCPARRRPGPPHPIAARGTTTGPPHAGHPNSVSPPVCSISRPALRVDLAGLPLCRPTLRSLCQPPLVGLHRPTSPAVVHRRGPPKVFFQVYIEFILNVTKFG
jgi:hypothetical protein